METERTWWRTESISSASEPSGGDALRCDAVVVRSRTLATEWAVMTAFSSSSLRLVHDMSRAVGCPASCSTSSVGLSVPFMSYSGSSGAAVGVDATGKVASGRCRLSVKFLSFVSSIELLLLFPVKKLIRMRLPSHAKNVPRSKYDDPNVDSIDFFSYPNRLAKFRSPILSVDFGC